MNNLQTLLMSSAMAVGVVTAQSGSARGEVAQYRPQPQTPEQRHGNHRGPHQHHDRANDRPQPFCGHWPAPFKVQRPWAAAPGVDQAVGFAARSVRWRA